MKKKSFKPPVVLSIAGSDSGGGAGIQADIKTISANGAYALTVITAITAQNTLGVQNISAVSPELIEDQLQSVFEDFKIDSVKIGMLHNPQSTLVVSNLLKKFKPKFVVLDPVMVSSSGTRLVTLENTEAMIENLFPICDLITPNFDETISFLSTERNYMRLLKKIKRDSDNKEFLDLVKECAISIIKMGANNIFITGIFLDKLVFSENCNNQSNHRKKNLLDVLYANSIFTLFEKKKIFSKNTHGTGCTLSSAIAASFALGKNMIEAVDFSQKYVYECIRSAKDIEFGTGTGPINHNYSPHCLKILN